MDFTNLNNQFGSYWQNKDYQKAIRDLASIDNYISQGNMDTFLVPENIILMPDNLAPLYASQTNQDLNYVVTTVQYSDLISWFQIYLQGLISEIVDNQTKVNALVYASDFGNIISTLGGAISGATNFLTSPLITIGIVSIVLFFLIKDI